MTSDRMRRGIAVGGVALVTLYAALTVVHALVLDPLAAVPGVPLSTIYDHLAAADMDVALDIGGTIAAGAVGVALAIGVAVLGFRTRMSGTGMVALYLALIVLGAPVVFESLMGTGMDVADTYFVAGGSHTVWAGVLWATSVTALLTLPFVPLAARMRARRVQPAA